VLCELSNVINHKEMDDRNDGEPDGSPFFVCPVKGAAAFFAVAPLITQLQKRAGCQQWGKPVYLDG